MEQLDSQLIAADVVLATAVLDCIDEVVSPGTTLNPADNSFNNPSLELARLSAHRSSQRSPRSCATASAC